MKKKLRFLAWFMLGCVLVFHNSCKKEEATPPPTITSFEPTDGVEGATVTITGTNFSTTLANNVVKFNGIPAVVTASTATSITTTVPATATSGTLTVEVAGNSAASTASFRVDLRFVATLNGASEAPANSSTATGSATLTYNKDTKIFSIVVTFSGLTATNGHIHKGVVGVSGPVVYPFVPPFTSPINYTSPALTADQEADLIGGLTYVNIHTAALPAGEIRGQLLKP